MATPARVFVSYSHEDERRLQDLRDVLAPLIREERIFLWDDKKIRPGDKWEREIAGHALTVTIKAEDMASLDKESLETIQMYEDSMRQQFDRIKALYPTHILPNGKMDKKVETQLRNLARAMCEDLNRILRFLEEGMGKILDDHYVRCRDLCRQLRS